MPAAPPPIVEKADPCAPPKGFKGKFTPPKECAAKPQPKAPPTRSHAGQFVLQLSVLELPYFFNQVTERAPGSRVGWLPTLGLGWGSGQNETVLKFGVGVNRYANDTAFAFGIERRHYFGTGLVKGIFAWSNVFSAGGAVTVSTLISVALGLQIDPSRRWGFYVMCGPGVIFTIGGSGTGNSDAGFGLVTHAGAQVRF